MASAKKRDSAARARIAEIRRAQQARERRNRLLAIISAVVVVTAVIAGGVVLVQSQSDDDGGGTASDGKGTGKFVAREDGVREWDKTLGRTHVTKTVDYPMRPPVGGDHDGAWMNCDGDVYTKEINDMNAVHSLEHGAVWVTYTDKASKADVDALTSKVKSTPYTLMSPYQDQADPIMLSAWGHQRTVTGADDPDLDKFLEEFVQGEQTPEQGATCSGGKSQ